MRYRLDPPAKLVDRDGNSIGILRSITLDTRDLDAVQTAPSPVGDIGGAVEVGEQTALLGRGESEGGRAPTFDPVAEAWSHYCSVMKPRNSGLDAGARAIIRDALKVATLSECKRAIDGCKASPFHMGENDRHKKYNRLSQILKGKRGGKTTREQIDMFLEIAERSGLPSGVTSADPAKVNQAKRDVLDAFDFPGDEHAVRRGEASRVWLLEQGFTIGTNSETGRPTFKAGE